MEILCSWHFHQRKRTGFFNLSDLLSPHILSLSWRASRNMSALDAYILLNFTYRFSHATSLSAASEAALQLCNDTSEFYYSFINSIPSNSSRSFQFHPLAQSNILHTFSSFSTAIFKQFSKFECACIYLIYTKCEVSFTN